MSIIRKECGLCFWNKAIWASTNTRGRSLALLNLSLIADIRLKLTFSRHGRQYICTIPRRWRALLLHDRQQGSSKHSQYRVFAMMYELRGRGLLIAVSVLTSLGFLLVGFDNGLMGGMGTHKTSSMPWITELTAPQLMAKPSTTPLAIQMLPWLVWSSQSTRACLLLELMVPLSDDKQLDVSSVLSLLRPVVNCLVAARALLLAAS